MNVFSKSPNPTRSLKYNRKKITMLGGLELWVLYTCYMNFDLAAEELGTTEVALKKWFQRFKASARIQVLDRYAFHLFCSE